MCKVIGTPILYLMPFIDNSGKMSQSIIWTFYLFFLPTRRNIYMQPYNLTMLMVVKQTMKNTIWLYVSIEYDN